MNNNMICNPKVEVPTGTKLNDKDYVNDLLSCLKEMEKNYVTAMSEASNEYLYEEYEEMFENYTEMQREVYELMFRKGWYSVEKADANKVNNKYNMLNQEFNSLNG